MKGIILVEGVGAKRQAFDRSAVKKREGDATPAHRLFFYVLEPLKGRGCNGE
ncbi:hypothetical protein V1502_14485 [Bacillus sp. SCS-153A]|uniref:hypothetical protein n=1 Tax=Rossellomorea sedimentorum TaxID=3115294 RepID=UPI0039057DCC